MSISRLRLSVLPVALCLGVAPSSAQLADASPFLPKGAVPAPQTPLVQSGVLELRGVLPTPNGFVFSIYNTTRKKSTYVALNENGSWGSEGGTFVVRSHRQVGDQDQVTVDYQGQTLTLSTKSPKVATAGRGALPVTTLPAVPSAAGNVAVGGAAAAAPAGARGGGGPGAGPAGRAGGGRGAAAAGGQATTAPMSPDQAASLSEAVSALQRARAESVTNPAVAPAVPSAPAPQTPGGRGGRAGRGGN